MSNVLAPSRTLRFSQPLSPLRLDSIVEGCEYQYGEKEEPPAYEAPLAGRTSPHRTKRPLVSILKRKSHLKNDSSTREKGANRFEISVIPYRSSCCRTVVCVEHITDSYLEEAASDGQCPSCKAPCTFESSTRAVVLPTPRKAGVTSPLSPTPKAPSQAHTTYAFFGDDDEGYPVTEHSIVLGSPMLSTDMSEGFVRVTSIAGMTLFLFALLS
ncbi:hypothetical protein FPV67DRAFT_361783 [Lyophyllum atratum]|nr:hypothetical protein FPV67DRAFT_361783 [Lyophyllum atratum]